MDILTEDMKKELRKKFNGLDTKDEKFQEKSQAIVEELIEVNKKKIGDIVVKKTVDEALEEEKEDKKEIKQLMSEVVLEDLQDNELRNSLEQQAKDGIVDEISEKVSLEKAGFLKEPQKPVSVEDIIEEVLNQLEEIVEEKKKELDNEIAEKEEVIKKVEKREKLKVSKAKMNNLHQKTKTYKGTEGKNLNENVEKAIVDLDQQIKALVAETTVDNKELQSEDLEKERKELIEQKNKLDDMLKSIKEKYMKDKSKNSDKTKENNNFQEDDKKRKEDKSKDDKEDNSKEEKKDKTKGSKKEEVKNYPVFCKKDTDQGGRHAYKIENEDELKMYAKADMIICEYLPGEEVTVDCFTNKKRNLVFCNPRAADRILAGIDVHARRIDLTPEIKYIAESLNKEIEFRGYWFFQIKKAANGKFKLLEIATRLPGSFSLSRCLDVNLPLMALKDFDEQDVELTFNNVEIEADKQFFGKYKLGIDYDSVFIDFETCFEKIKKVNTFFMMFLYKNINKNIKIKK